MVEEAETIFDRADVYNDFYVARGKDYAAESARILDIIHARVGTANSLLDFACGAGDHLREFALSLTHLDGVDVSRSMVETARRKGGTAKFHQGDMRTFQLKRKVDAVTCLFSSVGYLRSTEELENAVLNMANHLSRDGVLIVEPWWFPETFLPNYVGADIVTVDDRRISRVSHTTREGEWSRMTVHYTLASPTGGIEHFSDSHLMRLFTRTQYEDAFTLAGLDVTYSREDLFAPGLFIASRRVAE